MNTSVKRVWATRPAFGRRVVLVLVLAVTLTAAGAWGVAMGASVEPTRSPTGIAAALRLHPDSGPPLARVRIRGTGFGAGSCGPHGIVIVFRDSSG